MVGVPKSDGCAPCKRRKIGCDRTWPACRNCQQGRRDCPGPSLRYAKFVDEGPKQRARRQAAAASDRPCSGVELVRGQDAFCRRACVGLPAAMSPSLADRLARHLVETLMKEREEPASQLRMFGPFIGEVPRMLGAAAALDSAANCLADMHAVTRRGRVGQTDPTLYGTALASLRAAVAHPDEGRSTLTLCAAALMAMTEAYAVGTCGTNRTFIAHLGGAAQMLRLRGPAAFQDAHSVERAILRAVTVGIALDALFSGRDNILTEPEWHAVAFDTTGLVEPRLSLNRIARAMSYLPALARDARAYHAARHDESTAKELLARAASLKGMLAMAGPFVEAAQADPALMWRAGPDRLAFANAGIAFSLWFFWAMSIAVDGIAAGLAPQQHDASLALACVGRARLLRDSWPWARGCRPLGAMYLDVGLILAHKALRLWGGEAGDGGEVLEALAGLSEGARAASAGDAVPWTVEHVERVGAWLTGGAVDERVALPPNGLRVPSQRQARSEGSDGRRLRTVAGSLP
ncbi:uncharacterized protein K452DRAFT_301663 [Aplosporella prunicola CBS 121167]|uniref:Zn(2)-C6 fungal-type domain-containing protein n=1 Tax=Aplosporella prunicola CBS 121167 TaxID=1176127 RepID=A0A6A6B1A5_9PEZI|nr:uncharacterized protein K452DRAFT_301663 [Aplosporella prunicola CBS 121167]KAF2137949.1 hypothetical protein K452DRAFT_301663 [Aplosporella prunicola CBS 121167]